MTSPLTLQSTRTAWVDRLREEHASAAVQVLGITGFALLTVLGAQVRLHLWEVPFTLQTLAVYGSGLFLGWRSGMLAQLLYLTLGLFFPVFAGDTFGPAYLFGAPTAGYLLAFPLAAALVGYLSRRWNTLTGSVLAMLIGSLLYFGLGTAWLHTVLPTTWTESLFRGWIAFLPFDLAKILGAGLLYAGLRRMR